MEVDDLGTTKRGKRRFSSSDLNPQRSITAKEDGVKICFLHADTSNNEFSSVAYVGYHRRLMKESEMLSITHINTALT